MNPVEFLSAVAGSWRGTNTLQDPNFGKPEESPSTLMVSPILGGRFVRVDYTWGYQGKPHEGSLLVGYYTQCLGFSLISKDQTTAKLKRDEVVIGLAVNGQDPEQASCWFSVGDVDALWREFDAKGIGPGMIDEQEYDGKPIRVFFAKDPNGVCFCFTHRLRPKEDA